MRVPTLSGFLQTIYKSVRFRNLNNAGSAWHSDKVYLSGTEERGPIPTARTFAGIANRFYDTDDSQDSQNTVTCAVLCILARIICIPAASAAGLTRIPPVVPANTTSLTDAAQESFMPFLELEPQKAATLLNLESGQTTFPGPRSMASGPRYIRLASDLPAILIIAVAGYPGVSAVILFLRKMGGNKKGQVRSGMIPALSDFLDLLKSFQSLYTD